jgi:hypothetical protein
MVHQMSIPQPPSRPPLMKGIKHVIIGAILLAGTVGLITATIVAMIELAENAPWLFLH